MDIEKEIVAAENVSKKYNTQLKAPARLTSLEMRSLIFEALSIEDPANTPWGYTFNDYNYRGCVHDLRAIVEHLAVQRNLVTSVVEIRKSAWGCPGELMHFMSNTNLNQAEDDLFTEEFHFMIYQNVISPGAIGNMGSELPYFHVTSYGRECLKKQDILPYDPDGYIAKIKRSGADAWETFYASEAIRCFNCGAYSASVIMIGLLGEYLAEQLIAAMDTFLAKNETHLATPFHRILSRITNISQRYAEYETQLENVQKLLVNGVAKYPDLCALKPKMDVPAKALYATFVRLTRNSLMHPSSVQMERLDCLAFFITFVKYFETQHEHLDFYKRNS